MSSSFSFESVAFVKSGKDRNNLHISVFMYTDQVRWGHLDGVIMYRSKLEPLAYYSKKGKNSECKNFKYCIGIHGRMLALTKFTMFLKRNNENLSTASGVMNNTAQ